MLQFDADFGRSIGLSQIGATVEVRRFNMRTKKWMPWIPGVVVGHRVERFHVSLARTILVDLIESSYPNVTPGWVRAGPLRRTNIIPACLGGHIHPIPRRAAGRPLLQTVRLGKGDDGQSGRYGELKYFMFTGGGHRLRRVFASSESSDQVQCTNRITRRCPCISPHPRIGLTLYAHLFSALTQRTRSLTSPSPLNTEKGLCLRSSP